MTGEIVVTRDPLRGPRRRDRYEPREDGGYRRIEEIHTGCKWRYVGSELVEDVDVEAADEVFDA